MTWRPSITQSSPAVALTTQSASTWALRWWGWLLSAQEVTSGLWKQEVTATGSWVWPPRLCRGMLRSLPGPKTVSGLCVSGTGSSGRWPRRPPCWQFHTCPNRSKYSWITTTAWCRFWTPLTTHSFMCSHRHSQSLCFHTFTHRAVIHWEYCQRRSWSLGCSRNSFSDLLLQVYFVCVSKHSWLQILNLKSKFRHMLGQKHRQILVLTSRKHNSIFFTLSKPSNNSVVFLFFIHHFHISTSSQLQKPSASPAQLFCWYLAHVLVDLNSIKCFANFRF